MMNFIKFGVVGGIAYVLYRMVAGKTGLVGNSSHKTHRGRQHQSDGHRQAAQGSAPSAGQPQLTGGGSGTVAQTHEADGRSTRHRVGGGVI